jgi:hypothetical protein
MVVQDVLVVVHAELAVFQCPKLFMIIVIGVDINSDSTFFAT